MRYTTQADIVAGRLFTGTFRCTDGDSNMILSNAFEYRMPSQAAEEAAIQQAMATGQTARADMTSRFVGLIVVPGKQITKVEVEERRDGPGVSHGLSIRTR
ncbi:hypothetical protein, variant 2 [Exophiala mesophila]|uniref:Sm domain-containing protein n=1 Tax=Exophiala mesophila TaxID=212818 RepID=A0A0D1ZJ92_EXOME|nr:hypothetical protein, variant 1 [Exophiala mesophila]XP_016226266.1 hypothetical protein, variant 2 [Exophiala mesophila]KIV94691.1 hypothetical protein, variant 1 [Exophiala mesophila]KIV94692.1 hypothetical protein, variant 2 [Exophiala mesophila]